MKASPQETIICNAKLEHAGELYSLLQESRKGQMCSESAFRKKFWQNLYDIDFKYLVAIDSDGVVGFIGIHLVNSLYFEEPVATVENLVIKKTSKSTSVKKKLIRAIQNLIRSQNVSLNISLMNSEIQLAQA